MSIPRSTFSYSTRKIKRIVMLMNQPMQHEKLARFIELNDDGPQSSLNTTFTQDHNVKMPSLSTIMDMKAFIIKSKDQPSQLYAKHAGLNAKKARVNHMMTKCNACEKINMNMSMVVV